MNSVERYKKIVEITNEYGFADANMLSELLDVSAATIRRDFILLSRQGAVRKMRGGIVSIVTPEQFPAQVPPVSAALLEERRMIGRRAAGSIHPGDTIFLGAGSTCRQVAPHIREIPDLTVVTHNFGVVDELADLPNIKLIFCGGELCNEANQYFTIGMFLIGNLQRLHIGKVFITVNGISIEHGLSINDHRLHDVYSFLHRQADETIVLVDSAKFGRRAFSYFCPLNAVSTIVSSPDIDPKYFRYCQEQGVRLVTG